MSVTIIMVFLSVMQNVEECGNVGRSITVDATNRDILYNLYFVCEETGSQWNERRGPFGSSDKSEVI